MKKKLWQISAHLMIQILNKAEKNYLDIRKFMGENPTLNITLTCEKLKTFSLIRNKARTLISTAYIQHSTPNTSQKNNI